MFEQICPAWSCEDGFGWRGTLTFSFGGRPCLVDVLIQEDGPEITPRQKQALVSFLEQWPNIQPQLFRALIRYYNETERFSYGPEEEAELRKWWPDIQTEEALLQAVSLETIVVAEDFLMEDGRRVYLLFSRAWGGEDLDDNGLGVCFINEAVAEIGYKDIAF